MEQKIREILCKANPEIESYEGEDIIGDMGIDSHDIFNIVIGISPQGIEINPIYLKVSNFTSLSRIEKMIREIKGC